MVPSDPTPPKDAEPGTLTSLLDEVFRVPEQEQAAWAEGLAPGTPLGRYDLIREVGRGGAGVIWEARDRELGRRVAVKVLRRRQGAVPELRLIAEAEVAARLSHPGIVTTLDVGRNEKGAWLVQEFLVGRTLSERLRVGPVPPREALRIALQVAAALDYAHRHGVVHRDLTASNVFLCEDWQVKVLDLGMAQAFGRRKLEGGTSVAMAPEQARGEPEDERVDVYALGVLLHRMIGGEPPFAAATPVERRAPPRLDVEDLPGLGDLLDRMLSAEPAERPRDAGAVLAELQGLEAALPRTGTDTRPGQVRVRRRTPPWVARAAVAGLLVASIAGGFVLGSRRGVAAPQLATPGVFGAAATSVSCNWGRATWIELERMPEGAEVRHGEMGGAGIAEVAGRKAWKVDSDWGQLILPLGMAEKADTFAIEAEFHIPPVTSFMRGASLHLFTEPTGGPKTGESSGGIVVGIGQEPGKPAFFNWMDRDAQEQVKASYVGTLFEPITGRWHLLRVEGSRSRKWFRVLLDGRTIIVAHGDFGFPGNKVILGAGYGYMNAEDVAWSNLRTFSGTADCQ
jgi:tRNA A-37 threonylcarbamoyl transferase component Bud32